jgi:hypothetical protein
MMFMIPIPPTTRLIPAIAVRSRVIITATSLATFAISSWLWTTKSSWPRCRSARIWRTCAAAIGTDGSSTAWT